MAIVFTAAQESELIRLWYTDVSNAEIASHVGVCGAEFTMMMKNLRKKLKLPMRPPHLRAGGRRTSQVPVPTVEEIEERAAAIRANWTPEEESRRWVGGRTVAYTIPAFRTTASKLGRLQNVVQSGYEF
jgi:hypothetical protein